jgi:hypothetical protein
MKRNIGIKVFVGVVAFGMMMLGSYAAKAANLSAKGGKITGSISFVTCPNGSDACFQEDFSGTVSRNINGTVVKNHFDATM